MIDGLDCATVARLRQGLYRFFGAALLTPDADRLAGLLAAAELIGTGETDRFAFGAQWRSLLAAVERLPPLTALQAEHVRLFEAEVTGARCPPWESQYRPRADGAAMLAVQLEAEYRRLGLAPAQAAHVPSDHASTELEVMAHLCGREAGEWEGDDLAAAARLVAEEEAFLDRHLAAWFPVFAHRLASVAATGFHRALAEAASAFVVHDQDYVSALRRAALTTGGPGR